MNRSTDSFQLRLLAPVRVPMARRGDRCYNARRARRGLTLLELLLALSITIMVASAIAAMLGAVSTGVGARRDTRTVMVSAHAAQSRLAAYLAPAHCVLSIDKGDLVLWLNDSRQSDSVHATEVRWLLFDQASGELTVSFVSFPDSWSQAACDLEDAEFASTSDWMSVLSFYRTNGWLITRPLVDNLDGVIIHADQPQAIDCRHLMYELQFATENGVVPITAAASIRERVPPAK